MTCLRLTGSIVLIIALSTTSVAQSTGPSPAQIAIILPLSGEHEHIGRQVLDAIELALSESSGVSWTVADTRGDATRARRLVEELADNPANVAIVGPIGAAESRAAAEAAASHRIPLLTLTSEAGVEAGGAFVFRLRVSPEEQSRQIARVALDELGLRRFAVLYPDDHFGRSAMRAFVDEAIRGGGRILALERYETDETNLTEPVELLANRRRRVLRGRAFRDPPRTSTRRLTSTSPVEFEALFIPDYDDRVGLILPFLAFWDVPLGGRTQLLGISSWGGRGLELSGELAVGALFTQVFHESMHGADVERFVESFRAVHGRVPSEAEAQAHDAISFLLEQLGGLAAGRVDRYSLAQALIDAPPYEGLGSPLALDQNGAVTRVLTLFAVNSSGRAGPYVLLR